MLQSLRERTQGIITGVIVVLIAITFVLFGVQNYLRGGANGIVAEVNGSKITQEDLRIHYERARQQRGSSLAFDQEAQKQLKAQSLKQMIRKNILLQGARKLGLYVSDRQIQAVVEHLPIFQVNGKFSGARFQEVLRGMFFSRDAFFKETENSLILSQLEGGILNSAFVLPNETDLAIKLMQQKRSCGYFLLDKARFVKDVKIGLSEISDYYKEHQKEFLLQEMVSVEYVELTTDQVANKMGSATIEKLQHFYKENIDLYSTPKSFQLEEIMLPLSSGEDKSYEDSLKLKIEAIAKKVQQGESFSLASSGKSSLKWVTLKDLDGFFARELSKAYVGKIIGPLRTKEGYALFKVGVIKPGEAMPFASVRDKVARAYTQQQLMHVFAEQNDKLADLAYTNSDSLQTVAKTLGLVIKNTSPFARDGGKEGIAANPKIAKAAFSDLVLAQKYNSNPIEISPGNVVVLRVKEHFPAKARSLAEVKGAIIDKLQGEKVATLARDMGQIVIKELLAGVDPNVVAKRHALDWKTISLLTRQDKRLPEEIVERAFSAHRPEGKSTQPSTVGVSLANGNYAVIKILEVLDGDVAKVAADVRQSVANDLQTQYGEYELALLINDWIKSAKVKRVEDAA